MLICWPFVIGARPEVGAEREVIARYGIRALAYIGLMCMTFLSAAFCATLIIRRNRAQYAEELTQNLRELVEGSLSDHGKSKSD